MVSRAAIMCTVQPWLAALHREAFAHLTPIQRLDALLTREEMLLHSVSLTFSGMSEWKFILLYARVTRDSCRIARISCTKQTREFT